MRHCSQIVLALLTACGFFGCIAYLLYADFPAANKDALNSLLGVLTTIFTLQMNFFFGSSSTSKLKDETVSEIAKAVASPPPAAPVTVNETRQGDINITPKDKPV